MKIGVTGGIASGKSTVAQSFSALGAPVLDADAIARDLVEPGRAGLQRVIAEFGAEFLDNQTGALRRAALREHVFSNPPARKRLEALLHPLIEAQMQERTRDFDAPYCLWVIPLLIETNRCHLVDRVLVVDSAEALQYRRALTRPGLTREAITAIMNAQTDRASRLAVADDLICNNADVTDVQRCVTALHQYYLHHLSTTLAPSSQH